MEFIKNERAFRKFKKKYEWSFVSDPLKFPCFAYFTVVSYGMEEDEANYLYVDDLVRMLSKCFLKIGEK